MNLSIVTAKSLPTRLKIFGNSPNPPNGLVSRPENSDVRNHRRAAPATTTYSCGSQPDAVSRPSELPTSGGVTTDSIAARSMPLSHHTLSPDGSGCVPMMAKIIPFVIESAARACSLDIALSSDEGTGIGSGCVCQKPRQCQPSTNSLSRSRMALFTSNCTRAHCAHVDFIFVALDTTTVSAVKSLE